MLHVFLCGDQTASVAAEYAVKTVRIMGNGVESVTAGKCHKDTAVTQNRKAFPAECAEWICENNRHYSAV